MRELKKSKDFQDYLLKVLEYHHSKEDKLKKELEENRSSLDQFIKRVTIIKTAISQKYTTTEEEFSIDEYNLFFNKDGHECGVCIFFDIASDITVHDFSNDRVFHSMECQKVINWLEKI